uniref:G_PROTEIN_RECEP_F1_2 domain-containing protein n=1 Tax=Heterorhabditis bacteriophora TaxID=37862 RepID=A0A1I7WPG4_HETBA
MDYCVNQQIELGSLTGWLLIDQLIILLITITLSVLSISIIRTGNLHVNCRLILFNMVSAIIIHNYVISLYLPSHLISDPVDHVEYCTENVSSSHAVSLVLILVGCHIASLFIFLLMKQLNKKALRNLSSNIRITARYQLNENTKTCRYFLRGTIPATVCATVLLFTTKPTSCVMQIEYMSHTRNITDKVVQGYLYSYTKEKVIIKTSPYQLIKLLYLNKFQVSSKRYPTGKCMLSAMSFRKSSQTMENNPWQLNCNTILYDYLVDSCITKPIIVTLLNGFFIT